MTRLHGIDISHWQHPGALPWANIAKTSQFVIARATNGTTRDRHVLDHAKRIRDHGLTLGLYHFFQHDQDPKAQAVAFLEAADLCGLGPGDIVPMLDIEDDTADKPVSLVTPSWSDPAREISNSFARAFGDAGTYITQADWRRLGEPVWPLVRPLWTPHWGVASPATPGGRAWSLWQYRVGPYEPGAPHKRGEESMPGALDHNWAVHPLPRIGCAPKTEPPQSLPAPPNMPTLKRGDRGTHVETLQRLLNRANASMPPLRDDGIFGAVTEGSLIAFQRSRGLKLDGVCGPITWGALLGDPPPRAS